MKQIFAFFALYFITLGAQSQDWSVFYKDQEMFTSVFNVTTESSSTEDTIKFTQVITNYSNDINSELFRPVSYTYFGKKLIKCENNQKLITYDNDTVFFQYRAPLNERWLFSRSDSGEVFAEIIGYEEHSFLGVQDSVQRIKFKSTSRIYGGIDEKEVFLSKHYGLIQVENLNDLERKLPELEEWSKQITGTTYIEGTNIDHLGIQNLKAEEIYDFEIGDEFHVQEFVWDFCNTSLTNHRYKILNREIFSDSILSYEVEELTNSFKDTSCTLEKYLDSTKIDTLRWSYNLKNHRLNIMPGVFALEDERLIYWLQHENAKSIVDYLIWRDDLEVVQELILRSCFGCYEPYYKGWGGPYWNYNQTGWGGKRERAFYKGSRSFGSPLQFVIASTNKISNLEDVKVYPTLVEDKIRVACDRCSDFFTLKITNQFGQLRNEVFMKSDEKIDLKDFPSGIYFVSIEKDNRIFVQKIIKK